MIRTLSDILVLSDMDGTLLDENKILRPANLETIRLFTKLGGRFSVATGRVAESVARYEELVELISPSITSGGCVVYDYQAGSASKNAIVPRIVAKKVVNELMRFFPQLGVIVMGADGRNYQLVASEKSNTLLMNEQITYFLHPQDELPPDWNKVVFAGPTDMLEDVEDYVSHQNYPGLYFVSTDPFYFEMMPQGVSKASGVQELCRLLDVPMENTIAIGDYYNDIDMMKITGLSVAMQNSPDEVKMLADYTTGHCNDCGVGQYLYKLVKAYG